MEIARRWVGLRETHGPNRSPDIDRWNRAVGAPLGSSYCASFVSACLTEANVTRPAVRTAWAKAFMVKGQSRTANEVAAGRYKPQPGDIVIWTRASGGHVGLVTTWAGTAGATIEANTSSGAGGSQFNGDGIWERRRALSPFSAFRVIGFTPVE